jgi:hypothetical protein
MERRRQTSPPALGAFKVSASRYPEASASGLLILKKKGL